MGIFDYVIIKKMKIDKVRVGELYTNCYIVYGKSNAVVIDPGFETEKIIEKIKDKELSAIILTHGHYDHVTEAFKLKEKTGAQVYICEDDEALMSFSNNERADILLNGGEILDFGDIKFEVIKTPGHTRGGICLYSKDNSLIFTGDTLFQGTYGRTDLPGGSDDDMENSLKILLKLPENTVVYPGHGKKTTIKDEKNLVI